MKAFDFEKLKRNYFISNLMRGMVVASLISIAVTSGVSLLSLMLLVFCNLIDSIWRWVPFLLMIIAFAATTTVFMRKCLKRCRKDFQEICDDISQYGKCKIIINYIGKLPKKNGTEFDVRFDSVYLYVRSKEKIVVKLTRTVSQIEVFTPDDKKVHVIGYAEFIPVMDYNITRRWNVAVMFSDGTALVIPVKSKRKGDLLADELTKAVENSQPTSLDSNDKAPVSLNKKTIAEIKPQESQKQNDDIAMPHIGSPLGILRYDIEHKIIRSTFFDNPETVIGALIQSNNMIFEIYDDAFQIAGINNPYSSKDFCVKGVRFDPDGFFMRIKLPKPEFFPLCYRIYLVCDLKFKYAEYYTIERGVQGGFFCKWDKDGAHYNICKINDPDFDAQDKVKEMLYNAEGIIIAGKFNENRAKFKLNPASSNWTNREELNNSEKRSFSESYMDDTSDLERIIGRSVSGRVQAQLLGNAPSPENNICNLTRENGENSQEIKSCPKCGSLEMGGTLFCSNCGHYFAKSQSKSIDSEIKENGENSQEIECCPKCGSSRRMGDNLFCCDCGHYFG